MGWRFFAAQWGSVMIEHSGRNNGLPAMCGGTTHTGPCCDLSARSAAVGFVRICRAQRYEKTGLRPFDRILGMAFGLLQAILLLWALTVVIWLTPLHNHAWWKQSRMAPLLDGSLRMMAPLLPASLKQWLPPALHGS